MTQEKTTKISVLEELGQIVDESGQSFADALLNVVACHIEILPTPIVPKLFIRTPYIAMEDLTKENVAPIVWQYGSDFKIPSEDAARKIKEELENKFSGSVSFNASKENQLVAAIREYRKGVSLESIAQKVIDIAETFSLGFTGGSFDLDSSLFPTLGGIGIGQVPVFCNSTVGDIVYKSPPDNTWLECDGRFVSSVDYPELYQFHSNCNWDPNWGKKAQMTTTSGIVSFNVPKISGAWIKALP